MKPFIKKAGADTSIACSRVDPSHRDAGSPGSRFHRAPWINLSAACNSGKPENRGQIKISSSIKDNCDLIPVTALAPNNQDRDPTNSK